MTTALQDAKKVMVDAVIELADAEEDARVAVQRVDAARKAWQNAMAAYCDVKRKAT